MINKETLQRLLNPDYEGEIAKFKELYLQNSKVPATIVERLINNLESSKGKIAFYKESALKEINVEARKILPLESFKEFDKISHMYIRNQKQRDFDSKHGLVRPSGDSMKFALATLARNTLRDRACEVTDDEVLDAKYKHKAFYLKLLYDCLSTYGLKEDLISKRKDDFYRYNVIVNFKRESGTKTADAEIHLTKQELLANFIDPYHGEKDIILNGFKIEHGKIIGIQVTRTKYKKDEIPLILRKASLLFDEKDVKSRIKFSNHCESVTREFINTSTSVINRKGTDYVSQTRIKELESIKKESYDLTKLIQLCRELNLARKNNLLYSPSMLIRAICDHVPPIFGEQFKNFDSVAAQYKSEKAERSFQKGLKRLQDFMRPAADMNLHGQIRSKESLPDPEQTNFSGELDFMLQEICRILKK